MPPELGSSGPGGGIKYESNAIAEKPLAGSSVAGPGIKGESNYGPGISGQSLGLVITGGIGAVDESLDKPASDGVLGQGNNGVHGVSSAANGVLGENSASGFGVTGTSTSGTGVYGVNGGGSGTPALKTSGVRGESTNGYGVYGASANESGVYGVSASGWGPWLNNLVPGPQRTCGVRGESAEGYGVYGASESATGVYGTSGPGSLAGEFVGDHKITGNASVGGNHDVSGNASVGGNHTVSGTISSNEVVLLGMDCAEEFDIVSASELEPGTVVVFDAGGSIRPSAEPYNKRVAGVISGAGEFRPGIILGRSGSSSPGKAPVALVGRVYCKVDASYSPILIGDMLTTSPTSGFAMKACDASRAFGAVIGKALAPHVDGLGLIPMLVALQ